MALSSQLHKQAAFIFGKLPRYPLPLGSESSWAPQPVWTLENKTKIPLPILQKAGWAPGPVWTGGKSRPHRDSIPDRPARSQSLYRLSYPAHTLTQYESLIKLQINKQAAENNLSISTKVLHNLWTVTAHS